MCNVSFSSSLLFIVLYITGYSAQNEGISANRSSCLKINQAKTSWNYTVEHITAEVGEKIVMSPVSPGFFLPEAPSNVQLKRTNASNPRLQWTPSRAGIRNVRYYLLKVVQEAEGPKAYIQYILINVSAVRLNEDSLFNYSCISIHTGVYRVFVKVWALSEEISNKSSQLTRGKYSMKMSNYLQINTTTKSRAQESLQQNDSSTIVRDHENARKRPNPIRHSRGKFKC